MRNQKNQNCFFACIHEECFGSSKCFLSRLDERNLQWINGLSIYCNLLNNYVFTHSLILYNFKLDMDELLARIIFANDFGVNAAVLTGFAAVYIPIYILFLEGVSKGNLKIYKKVMTNQVCIKCLPFMFIIDFVLLVSTCSIINFGNYQIGSIFFCLYLFCSLILIILLLYFIYFTTKLFIKNFYDDKLVFDYINIRLGIKENYAMCSAKKHFLTSLHKTKNNSLKSNTKPITKKDFCDLIEIYSSYNFEHFAEHHARQLFSRISELEDTDYLQYFYQAIKRSYKLLDDSEKILMMQFLGFLLNDSIAYNYCSTNYIADLLKGMFNINLFYDPLEFKVFTDVFIKNSTYGFSDKSKIESSQLDYYFSVIVVFCSRLINAKSFRNCSYLLSIYDNNINKLNIIKNDNLSLKLLKNMLFISIFLSYYVPQKEACSLTNYEVDGFQKILFSGLQVKLINCQIEFSSVNSLLETVDWIEEEKCITGASCEFLQLNYVINSNDFIFSDFAYPIDEAIKLIVLCYYQNSDIDSFFYNIFNERIEQFLCRTKNFKKLFPFASYFKCGK